MRKFVVIGLGMFGFYVAKSLYEKGHEVIAIDKNKEIVQKIKDFSTQAIVADATDKETLMALGVHDVDVAIVGLGTSLDASVLTTLYLKEMGIKNIIAKAITEDHGKILSTIGATEIIFPEKDIAVKVAMSASSTNLLDYLPLSEGYSIMEIAPPSSFIGKSIRDLQLRNRYGTQIIAVKELIPERINFIPSPDFVIKDSDSLIVMGKNEDLEKIEKAKK
ncbi:MAG: potassium transporter TrkA [Nitrospinae bacterium RIFCSPLOWO2_01_FULL_39_10]|nr:MAG: potassium transporter TrkA [Nitrospinae bacterium RIFCSPLOWO2_01_FULL_39_10]